MDKKCQLIIPRTLLYVKTKENNKSIQIKAWESVAPVFWILFCVSWVESVDCRQMSTQSKSLWEKLFSSGGYALLENFK